MLLPASIASSFVLLGNACYFFKKHFLVIMLLGLAAAFGRVIQLGGFGSISSWQYSMMEIVVEGSRICLFLYIIGLASVRNGLFRLKKLFTGKSVWRALFTTAWKNVRHTGRIYY